MISMRELQATLFHEDASKEEIRLITNEIKRRGVHRRIEKRGRLGDLAACAVGAVFSINVKPVYWTNALDRFSAQTGWVCKESAKAREVHSLAEFLDLISGRTDQWCAKNLYGNANRTSAKKGILKAEAARRFVEALVSQKINRRTDLKPSAILRAFRQVRRIEGQSSGISFIFFLILAGCPDFVKPDRRVRNFASNVLGSSTTPSRAAEIIRQAAYGLDLRPADLDLAIWYENAKR